VVRPTPECSLAKLKVVMCAQLLSGLGCAVLPRWCLSRLVELLEEAASLNLMKGGLVWLNELSICGDIGFLERGVGLRCSLENLVDIWLRNTCLSPSANRLEVLSLRWPNWRFF
jgi:hypothetical protein